MGLKLAVLAVLALGLVFLLRLSLASKRYGFEACLSWKGRSSCGRAWAESPAAARTAAIDNACGPLCKGMTERMACRRNPPERVAELH